MQKLQAKAQRMQQENESQLQTAAAVAYRVGACSGFPATGAAGGIGNSRGNSSGSAEESIAGQQPRGEATTQVSEAAAAAPGEDDRTPAVHVMAADNLAGPAGGNAAGAGCGRQRGEISRHNSSSGSTSSSSSSSSGRSDNGSG